MISDELKAALVSGAKDIVECGFCEKVWYASKKLDKVQTEYVDTPGDLRAIYEGDAVPFGYIQGKGYKFQVPVICDCEKLESFETQMMQNQDLIINYLNQLAQTEILIERKKLKQLEALRSDNDRFKRVKNLLKSLIE